MSVRHALLCLLAQGPRHGYQLRTEYETALGAGANLNIGQVYSTLQRLERDGLAEPEAGDTTDAAGPDGDDKRRPWQITEAGRAETQAWFGEPTTATSPARDDLTTKVMLATATGIVAALDLIGAERQAAMSRLQAVTAAKARGDDGSLATALRIDRSVLAIESQIRWLDLAEERLLAAGFRHDDPNPGARLPTRVSAPGPPPGVDDPSARHFDAATGKAPSPDATATENAAQRPTHHPPSGQTSKGTDR